MNKIELNTLYKKIIKNEKQSPYYQHLRQPAQRMRNHIIRNELTVLNNKQLEALSKGKVTFQYRTVTQQKELDASVNKSLREAKPNTYKKNGRQVYEYVLAKRHHAPLGIKKINQDGTIGKIYKTTWDMSHIKTMIHHNDPKCPCQNSFNKGNFYKAKTNISKGVAGKELCPILRKHKQWTGEHLLQNLCTDYGIYSGSSYKIHTKTHNLTKRLHIDRIIPKEETYNNKPVAIEFDGEQHDYPCQLRKLYPSTINKYKHKYNKIPHKDKYKSFHQFLHAQLIQTTDKTFRNQLKRDHRKNTYLSKKHIPLIRIKVHAMKKHGLSGTARQQDIVIKHVFDKTIYPYLKHRPLTSQEFKNAKKYLSKGDAVIDDKRRFKNPSHKEQQNKIRIHQKDWDKLIKHEQQPKVKQQAKRYNQKVNKRIKRALKNQPVSIKNIYQANNNFYHSNNQYFYNSNKINTNIKAEMIKEFEHQKHFKKHFRKEHNYKPEFIKKITRKPRKHIHDYSKSINPNYRSL